jgi:response regulator RpfG family c-di-GMP phosphodiesterase
MFILITASSAVQDRVRGLESGAADFVIKPAHPDELLARVRASLRMKLMRDELKADKQALADLNTSLQESYEGVLRLLVRLMEMRIPNAKMRAERAERICRWIGERLEMSPVELEELGTAARLHEIGKVGISEGLLSRQTENLTQEDRLEIETFPMLGEQLIDGIPRLKKVGQLIRHQLENYDGTGYPDKLMRQQIPLGSQILRVVNLLEYQRSAGETPQEETSSILLHLRGTILTPVIAQLAFEYIHVVEDPSWLEGKRQVTVFDLKAGMVLSHDLTTGSGTKLLPKDSVITAGHIEKILSHHHVDPVINGVYIYDAR